MSRRSKAAEDEGLARLALVLVETGFRNSRLEELHAGVSPSSAVGDYSDVKVVTPYGEIAWAEVSRLCDAEMKALMIEVVNRVYTILQNLEAFNRLLAAGRWNRPELDPALLDVVARWEARQRGVSDAEIWATWPLDESKRLPPLRIEHRVADPHAEGPPRERWSFDASPDALRALAEAPVADADWIAKAREGLRQAADGWEGASLQVLDEIEAAGCGTG